MDVGVGVGVGTEWRRKFSQVEKIQHSVSGARVRSTQIAAKGVVGWVFGGGDEEEEEGEKWR